MSLHRQKVHRASQLFGTVKYNSVHRWALLCTAAARFAGLVHPNRTSRASAVPSCAKHCHVFENFPNFSAQQIHNVTLLYA